jgi:hypothetical protein
MGIALEHMKIAYMFLPPIHLDGCKRPLYYSRALHILKRKERMQKICYTERIGKSVEQICYLSRALHILKWKERLQKASLLHGADWEICWTDMLLVKGSSYSEMKGTVAKDMLHGANQEICWTDTLLVKGYSNSKKKGTICYTEGIGKSVEQICY